MACLHRYCNSSPRNMTQTKGGKPTARTQFEGGKRVNVSVGPEQISPQRREAVIKTPPRADRPAPVVWTIVSGRLHGKCSPRLVRRSDLPSPVVASAPSAEAPLSPCHLRSYGSPEPHARIWEKKTKKEGRQSADRCGAARLRTTQEYAG